MSFLAASAFLVSCQTQTAPDLGIRHIIVIGVDGMSPEGIEQAQTPVLDSMVKNGASTFEARSVLPSSSSSNWASMIMGADTEQHGITSNGWEPDDYTLPARVSGSDTRFPSIFTLYHDQKPDLKAGAIYDWDGFGRLFNKDDVDFDIDGDHEEGTTRDAVAYIKEHTPDFTFIHLDHVDHAGHSEGHGTGAYYEAVEKADSLIGRILKATKEAGIFENTLFIIASDHGGLGNGHGGESPAEVNIPFILYGAGIKKGYQIEEAVYQYDNAATVAFAAGLEIPQAWIGRPVKGAFTGYEKPALTYKKQHRIAAPVLFPDNGPYAPPGGLFAAAHTKVTLNNPNTTGTMLYTVDGTKPTLENSAEYTAPFLVDSTTLVRAIVHEEGNTPSKIAEGSYRLVPIDKEAGVTYRRYFLKGLAALPDFKNLQPDHTGTTMEFTTGVLDSLEDTQNTAIIFESSLKINTTGAYSFYTNSDDGSKLYIEGNLIVDNDGDHGLQERSGSVDLQKGLVPIRLEYFNAGGGSYLDARYKGPGIGKQIIPADKLFQK